MDVWLISGIAVLAALIGGLVGGGVGYMGASALYDRIVRRVEIEATAARVTAPVRVDLEVRTPRLTPISVPVEAELVQATPNVELVARMLQETPDLGVRQIARILGVAPATAQSYVVKGLRVAAMVDGGPPNLVVAERE